MKTYFKFGAFSLFREFAEAERLRNARWKDCADSPAIEGIEIEGDCLWSASGGIGSWSLWSDSTIRPFGFAQVYRGSDSGLFDSSKKGQPLPFLSTRYVQVEDPGITSETASLIDLCRGSDSGSPDWLPQLRDAKKLRTTTASTKVGGYQGVKIETWQITLVDGTQRRWFVLTEGYCEGYLCEFFESQQAALNWRARVDWTDTECLECGSVFEQPGQVEPGAMGCDRCG
jgi:hypothetical protein